VALYHDATVTPSKADLLKQWVPTQPWCLGTDAAIEVIGAFRFDDPDGQVGIETHIVKCGDTVLHVPFTYRNEPVEGGDGLITEMHHTALGTRWVYDGLADSRYLVMLAGVAMTGQGEALGMVQYDGKWFIAPATVRIAGGSWAGERVSVDDFQLVSSDPAACVFQNDQFEMTVYRQPKIGPQPILGLTATWQGGAGPVVLAHMQER